MDSMQFNTKRNKSCNENISRFFISTKMIINTRLLGTLGLINRHDDLIYRSGT